MQLRAQLESPVILSSIQNTGKLYLEKKNINVPMKQSISVSLSRANKTRERCNQEKILFSFKKENLDNQGVLGETDKTGVGTESPGCTEMVTRNRISYFLRYLISKLYVDFHFDWEIPGPAHNKSSTHTGRGRLSYKEALDCVTADSWCSSPGLLWRTW